MKDKVVTFMHKLFFVALALVTLGGLIVFVMVVIGTIMGGEAGSAVILDAQAKVVPIYEWIMGIAVFVGIISMYLSKTYAYKMEKTKKEDKKEAK